MNRVAIIMMTHTFIFGVNSCLYTAYEDNQPNANFNENLRKRASINEEDILNIFY